MGTFVNTLTIIFIVVDHTARNRIGQYFPLQTLRSTEEKRRKKERRKKKKKIYQ